uniref:Uncharacterized protein n=1 Tax=Micrurus corallinus TaxID=54390 RepID=A0A2D4GU02_MICCO
MAGKQTVVSRGLSVVTTSPHHPASPPPFTATTSVENVSYSNCFQWLGFGVEESASESQRAQRTKNNYFLFHVSCGYQIFSTWLNLNLLAPLGSKIKKASDS